MIKFDFLYRRHHSALRDFKFSGHGLAGEIRLKRKYCTDYRFPLYSSGSMTHYSLSATVILKFLLFADVCSLPKTTMTKLSAKTVDQRAAMRVSFGSFNLLSPVDFFNPPFDPLPHRIGELLLLPLTTQRQSSAVINTTYYYYYYYLKLSHNQSE